MKTETYTWDNIRIILLYSRMLKNIYSDFPGVNILLFQLTFVWLKAKCLTFQKGQSCALPLYYNHYIILYSDDSASRCFSSHNIIDIMLRTRAVVRHPTKNESFCKCNRVSRFYPDITAGDARRQTWGQVGHKKNRGWRLHSFQYAFSTSDATESYTLAL